MKNFYKFKMLVVLLIGITSINLYSQYDWNYRTISLEGGEAGTKFSHVFMPCVLYNDDLARYEMWFSFSSTTGRPYQIGFAYSDDGLSWTVHPDPVLTPEPNTWEASTVEGPSVLRIDGKYEMWYLGFNTAQDTGGIGYATSNDGINWSKEKEVTPLLVYDTLYSSYPSLLYSDEDGYMMWYTAYNESDKMWIVPASSEDGKNWQVAGDLSGIITSGPDGAWDEWGVYVAGRSVLLIDNKYYLWYSGTNNNNYFKIGLATSEDGIKWQKYKNPDHTLPNTLESNPVLEQYGAGASKMVEAPTVLYEGDSLRMWFSGWDGTKWSILHTSGRIEDPSTSIFDSGTGTYQNPFALRTYPAVSGQGTNFEFQLKEAGFTTLTICNSAGQVVETVVSRTLSPGKHTFNWQQNDLAAGIYLYNLQVGNESVAGKLVCE